MEFHVWNRNIIQYARFLGKEKTCGAQNSCNFCYLIGWKQDDQKIMLLKVLLHKFVQLKFFWTQFKNDIPARSVQLEAVYLKALLYLISFYWEISSYELDQRKTKWGNHWLTTKLVGLFLQLTKSRILSTYKNFVMISSLEKGWFESKVDLKKTKPRTWSLLQSPKA